MSLQQRYSGPCVCVCSFYRMTVPTNLYVWKLMNIVNVPLLLHCSPARFCGTQFVSKFLQYSLIENELTNCIIKDWMVLRYGSNGLAMPINDLFQRWLNGYAPLIKWFRWVWGVRPPLYMCSALSCDTMHLHKWDEFARWEQWSLVEAFLQREGKKKTIRSPL